MNDDLLAVVIVGIGMLGAVIIVIVSVLGKAINSRAANRKELQLLKDDISYIKTHIEDIKEQLADIIIRLG